MTRKMKGRIFDENIMHELNFWCNSNADNLPSFFATLILVMKHLKLSIFQLTGLQKSKRIREINTLRINGY